MADLSITVSIHVNTFQKKKVSKNNRKNFLGHQNTKHLHRYIPLKLIPCHRLLYGK